MKNMNMKIKSVMAFVLVAGTLSVGKAQYDAMFTQYMFNEMFINPAYAGSKEAMSATLLNRQQWVSFPGRPVTTSFSLHGPILGNKMGAGLSFLNERIGPLNRNLLYASYAYRLKLDDNNTISMGLSGGMDNQVYKFSALKISSDVAGSSTDPQFAGTPNATAANFGLGLFYTSKNNAFAGFSIPRLLDNEVKLNNSGATIKVTRLSASNMTYYFTGGYLFNLSENYKLRTSAMMKVVKNAPAQMDLTANLLINNLIWAGLSYRTKSSISAIAGVQVNKQLLVSYSFDYTTNKIQSYSGGSHEIVINYLFSFTGKKIVTPRYF
ncbi:MAG: type IX secretion system membrane protein PorP/SprF [Bacteroidia bacterium]|nr:type IX secretion system membrane protein PorP/SprF [Bacteroidia bacterium]